MGRQRPRRLKDNEAQGGARTLRVSPQKLNLVAALIRGKKVDARLLSWNSRASASQAR
jgi:large subunit ribosomal protein L22